MTGALLPRNPKAIGLFRVLAATLGLVCAAGEAKASCVGLGSICASFDQAAAIFLADVESVGTPAPRPSVEVEFRILEVFKGTPTPTMQVVSSVESYRFAPGQRVLVYATRGPDGTWSSTCTRTKPSGEGDPEIKILRSLARSEPGGLIDGGLVTVYEGRHLTNRHPDVRTTLRPSSTRGPVLRAVTNSAGYFRFDWVGPGDYIVVLERRPGYERQQQRVRVVSGQRCLTLPPFVVPFPP
jgi:hypothetical protein